MITKPAIARGKQTFVTENDADLFKVISSAACELSSALVTAGGSSATFRLLDSNGREFVSGQPLPSYNKELGIALAARSSDSRQFTPAQPIPFKNGLVLVCEQGEGSNAECFAAVNGN